MVNWNFYGKLCIIGGFIMIIFGVIVTYIGGQVLYSGSSGWGYDLGVGLKYGMIFFVVGIIVIIIGFFIKKEM